MEDNHLVALRHWAECACARREYSQATLHRKLIERGASYVEATTIVDALVAEGFVDDLRFARAYVHDQFHLSHWGVTKIMEHLRYEHGISEDTLRLVRDLISHDDEEAALVALLRPRLRGIARPLTLAARAKLACFASRKGFAYERFAGALRQALNELEYEEDPREIE